MWHICLGLSEENVRTYCTVGIMAYGSAYADAGPSASEMFYRTYRMRMSLE